MSDQERRKDKERIDRAIELIEAEMPGSDMNGLAVGARALVMLLERRSLLLSLDLAGSDRPAGSGESEQVKRILQAVPNSGKAAGT